MKKTTFLIVVFLALSLPLALSPILYARFSYLSSKGLYVEEYLFSYQFSLTYYNRGNSSWTLSDADLAFPLFVNNDRQTVELVWSSRPVAYEVLDADGNSWVVFKVGDRVLSPGENLTIMATYKMAVRPGKPPKLSRAKSGTLNDIPGALKEEFCGPAACWQTDNEELRELAFNLSSGKEKVLDIVASFISWICENIEYGTYELPRYPNETYEGRVGDCDDQANLLITLCRVVGIPAYLQIGCIYIAYYGRPTVFSGHMWSGHIIYTARNIAWHGWAVVYIPPWGWLPVDLTASEGIEEDPLNAIRNAIYWAWITVLCQEVKVVDYIAEAREAREFLIENGIYIHEREELSFLGTRTVERPGALSDVWEAIGFYAILTACVIGVSTASVVLIIRRKGHASEGPEFPVPLVVELEDAGVDAGPPGPYGYDEVPPVDRPGLGPGL